MLKRALHGDVYLNERLVRKHSRGADTSHILSPPFRGQHASEIILHDIPLNDGYRSDIKLVFNVSFISISCVVNSKVALPRAE